MLITTTYDKGITVNKDIEESHWCENNLSNEPISFPESDSCTQTHPELENDLTCVYDLTSLGLEHSLHPRVNSVEVACVQFFVVTLAFVMILPIHALRISYVTELKSHLYL